MPERTLSNEFNYTAKCRIFKSKMKTGAMEELGITYRLALAPQMEI